MIPLEPTKFIFLDIDGVLNSLRTVVAVKEGIRNYMDPVAVQLLAVLHKATKAEIVVSSTWRKEFELEAIRQFLVRAGWENPPVLRYKTPELDHGFRGEEVAQFLDSLVQEGKVVESYAIFDDGSDFYTDRPDGHIRAKISRLRTEDKPGRFRNNQPLIQTADAYGLCASHVKIAQYVLNILPNNPNGNKDYLRTISHLREAERNTKLYQPL